MEKPFKSRILVDSVPSLRGKKKRILDMAFD
jgi:hypothetical protein